VAVWTKGIRDLWLDEFVLRFGYATRDEAVLPNPGPRRAE